MQLNTLFSCPRCRGRLKNNDYSYKCTNCSSKYSIADEVPIFLTGERDSDSMNEYWDQGWDNRFNKTDHVFYKNESSHELRDQIQKKLDEVILNNEHAITETLPINDKVVLNIGCGIGEAAAFLLLGAINYIGIDYSYRAAKYSLETIKKLGGSGLTAQANAERLPIEENSIDIAYSHGVLHHTPETQVTLDEVFRVLKPSGKGVIGLYSTWSPTFITARFIGTFKALFLKKYSHWYQEGEGAWKTEESLNPWTKTYTLRELKSLFSKYDISKLSFRRTSFSWANAIPKLGKHIGNTYIGKLLANKFHARLGSMWIITFEKNFPRNS